MTNQSTLKVSTIETEFNQRRRCQPIVRVARAQINLLAIAIACDRRSEHATDQALAVATPPPWLLKQNNATSSHYNNLHKNP
jgi:hypothetical protein